MRFKDFIVTNAIKSEFNRLHNNIEPTVVQTVYKKLAEKLGSNIIETVKVKVDCECSDKRWKDIVNRKETNGFRYLEWNKDNQMGIYFDAKGFLYQGLSPKTLMILSPITSFDTYEKHFDFLSYACEYYKASSVTEKYFLVGINNNKSYFINEKGEGYYKQGVGDIVRCPPDENEIVTKYLNELG